VLAGHDQAATTQASSNAVGNVLRHPHLFPSLLEWLVIDARDADSRRHLSTMALVCKQWKELARQDKFWQGMTEGLFPAGEEGAGRASIFSAVAAYGRCLVETPMVMSERLILTDVNDIEDYADGMRWLHIDISDTRDGFVYYKCCGALVVVCNGGVHLAICPDQAVASAPFTGAERGGATFPPDEFWESNEDNFFRQYGDNIRVRIFVSCRRTGRRVMLWNGGPENFQLIVVEDPEFYPSDDLGHSPPSGSRRITMTGAYIWAPEK